MLGVFVNAAAIVIGGLFGVLFGHILPERMKTTTIQGIGLAVILIGLSMALQTKNSLIVIGSLVIGGIFGEWINIELRLEHLGHWLENKLLTRQRQGGAFTQEGRESTARYFCSNSVSLNNRPFWSQTGTLLTSYQYSGGKIFGYQR